MEGPLGGQLACDWGRRAEFYQFFFGLTIEAQELARGPRTSLLRVIDQARGGFDFDLVKKF